VDSAHSQQHTSDQAPLKSRLVDVATGLLIERRDVKRPTMRQIATAAGVAPGAAYRHFESQDDLFLAVVAKLFSDLEASLTKAIEGEPDPTNSVRRFAHAFVIWGLENSGGYQLLFEQTDGNEVVVNTARPGLHMINRLAIMVAGNPTPTPLDLQKATLIWVAMHGVVSLRMHKTGMPWPNAIESDVDHLLDALLNR
jgi:AcrR family transcriptional regulator